MGILALGAENPLTDTPDLLAAASTLASTLALVIDRNQLSAKLEKTQKELVHLGSFPELNPAAIIELDPEGRVQYMNPAAKEKFPEWQQSGFDTPLLRDLPQVISTQRAANLQSQIREIRVGETWYQQVLVLVPNSVNLRSFVIDITERKRVEHALQKQNDYLEALHATTLGLIGRLDLNEVLV